MVFAAVNPRQRVAGSPFENVAEEVLNGLFCHYEPPVSEYAQHKAAVNVKLNPRKYSFSQVKKVQSILRTSRLHRKKHVVEASKKKGVTWRDERHRKGIEAHIEGCAADNCDFLGLSRKEGTGLADSISPTQKATSVSKVPTRQPFPEPIIKHTPTSREPLKDAAPKKVLYDDEGNPINDDNSSATPSLSPGDVPPAPTGLSQLRQMAKQLDDDIYEPEDYDNPHSSVASEDYNERHRAPPRHPTPRHARGREEYAGEDKITMARSQSPTPSMPPNHYDTPEQFEDRGYNRGVHRPSTPFRHRGDNMEIDHADNSIVDPEATGLTTAISPSRRSDVYSDLTMDDAISGRNSGYHRAVSPAKSSEGVEVEVFKGRARPQSRSPSKYRDDGTPVKQVVEEPKSRIIYDDMGNVVGRESGTYDGGRLSPAEISRRESKDSRGRESPNLSKKNSREDRRRHSLDELPKPEERLGTNEPQMYKSRSRRISEPLPPSSRAHKSLADDGYQTLQKVPSYSHASPPIVETVYSPQSGNTSPRKRDPTPRMSLEPTFGEDTRPLNQGPLPPTPRRKEDKGRQSPGGARDKRRALQEEIRLRRKSSGDDERRQNRRSPGEDKRGDSRETEARSDGTPSSQQAGGNNMYDWAYNALLKPFSPRSMATDDEIRAEVSSVGMESNTLRPFQYPNPFLMRTQPTIKEERAPDLRPASSDDSDPSSISNSTLSSQDRQPVKKASKPTEKSRPVSSTSRPASSTSRPPSRASRTSKSSKGSKKPSHNDIQPSNSSGSTRTKKLWKGWKNAVGKVKAIVKDIDEQRIPPPAIPGYNFPNPHLQPTHPTLGKSTHQHGRKTPSS